MMDTLRRIAKNTPFIRELARTAFFVAGTTWVPLERARLSRKGEHRLAGALAPRRCALCDQIELWRGKLRKDRSLLADGSLGPAGPYDQGQTVADVCNVSKRGYAARLLFSLASEYAPRTILELGTNIGISSAYLAASGNQVTTLEASPYRLRVAKRLHESLGLKVDYVQGLFTETLGETLDRIQPLGMAFIDGHHQYRPTLEYFEAIAAKTAPNCIFVFDDIRWSSGMWKAWTELRRDPRFEIVVDLGGMGMGILGSDQARQASVA